MEMELQRQTLEGYRSVFDGVLSQEETLECIVPDALPDVARIVSAAGRVFLKGRQAQTGALRLNGTVQVAVVYIPEGEQAPRIMEAELPFQCVKDCPKVQEGCQIQAEAWVVFADARAMNPRKLMIRAGLSFQVTAYEQEMREVTCDATDGGQARLEKRFVERADWAAVQVVERPFLFSDVLRPPASRPAMEELLYCRIHLGAAEAKAIGKKLICKGELHLRALYRSGEEILSAGFELPFSQIFELDRPIEDCQIELSILVTGLQCALQDGELTVSVEALAQAVLWGKRPLTLLSDAYSTTAPLDVERAPCPLWVAAGWDARRETARQSCECGIPAKEVLDCFAAVESLECALEEGGMRCTAQLRVEVLYLSEEGALCGMSDSLPVSCRLELPEGSNCRCRCAPVGPVTAVPVTGGLEVRCEALFTWMTTREESVPCVLSLKPGTVPATQSPRPSLIIRRVGEGESLWDVAKACGAALGDIRAVNGLEEEQAPQGTLLLIPTQRG
ncbi:MAG TPA: DUF3794 domain-containing protein [Candidatus Enterenecus merdae]|nr:DUF3794 domain-containing protein [Candidatus Enterenecus merdae]